MKSKYRQILIHVTGCLIFLSLPILFSPDLTNSVSLFKIPPFQRDFISYICLILFFYINFYILLPRFYFSQRYFAYIIFILFSYAVVTFIPTLLISGNNDLSVVPKEYFVHRNNFFLFYLSQHFFKFLIVLVFSLLLKINERWKQAEKEKLNTELSFLKAQINPHFLFNTLNSIYSLAITEKATGTSSAIVKLSGMMRYVISETNENFVSLSKEINYISNYIDLQKNRFENTVKINYSVTGTVEGKQIAPLILIQFVENAFKHGVNAEENSFIEISIVIKETELDMAVFNNKVTALHDGNSAGGLGIENTKTRLQLLYPGKHLLTIKNNSEDFSVLLNINLQ